MTELIVTVLAGVLRVLEQLLLVMSSVVVAAPQVASNPPTAKDFVDLLTWPIRAGVAHPGRLALLVAAFVVYLAVSVRA